MINVLYIKYMLKRYDRIWKYVANILERLFAVATLLAIFWYGIESISVLVAMDWSLTTTFQEFINRVLIAIIGLELVRLLLYHNIGAILELLAFVIARKMLHPNISAVDIALSTVAFAALLATRHYFTQKTNFIDDDDE